MASKDGKYVECHDWAPKQQNKGHAVHRAVCLVGSKENCATCVHNRFVLRIPMGGGDQTVLCPRWKDDYARKKGHLPTLYTPIRRETCLRSRPFELCTSCPNSKPAEPPRNVEGWYEDWRDGKDPYG